MAFKDLETKRSLRKKYRDSKDQLKYTQKVLQAPSRSVTLRTAVLKKQKQSNKVTALYVAERAKNAELVRKLKALETPESEVFNFECVGVKK